MQDYILHSLFTSGNCSTFFGWYLHPTSDAVDTFVCPPDDGWKYHPKHVEQFSDINKLCRVAFCCIYTYIGINSHYFTKTKFSVPFSQQPAAPRLAQIH